MTFNSDQLRFLRLHRRNLVESWRWYWSDTLLRATTVTGRTATIGRDDLDELVQAGLMEFGIGCADVALTPAGYEYGS